MTRFHLSLQPNETLYSVLSRIAISMGYPTAGIALQLLFGSKNKQLSSAFISVIPQLSELTGIDRRTLTEYHTVLPLFRSFVPKERYQVALVELADGRNATLDKLLSTSANGMKLSGEMRYCPLCCKEQTQRYGYPYWYIHHQLPGVYVCLKHQQVLIAVKVIRKKLALPGDTNILHYAKRDLLLKLATFATDAWKMPLVNYCAKRYRHCIRERLDRSGYGTEQGRIRQEKWQREFTANWTAYSYIPDIAELLENEAGLYLQSFFYNEVKVLSPLKNLLVLACLFDSWQDFKEFYRLFDEQKNEEQESPVITDKAVRVPHYIPDQHGSLRSFAKRINCSVITAKKIALQQGVQIDRRPQLLFGAERDMIKQLLKDGLSTAAIAAKIACSVASVEQILTQNPDIVALRKNLRLKNTRQKHRTTIRLLLNNHSGWRRSDVQNEARAAYTWLYKHDSDWLYQQLPAETPRQQRWSH
ncbi:TnsD family Tn7-like transposition protein [Rheinheimera gaetbuli]